MTFLLDENISFRIADAFSQLGKSVRHVAKVEELGRGSTDLEILRFIQRREWRLISLDRRILRPAHKKAEFLALGCAGYFLKTSSRRRQDPWTVIEILVARWREIEAHAQQTAPPYAMLIRPTGTLRPM